MEIEFLVDKFLCQKIEKEIKTLFIQNIYYLESLLSRGAITEEEFSEKRKEILDSGNGAIRILKDQVESLFKNIKNN